MGKTKLYAEEANAIDLTIDWNQIENLAWKIENQKFDYDYDEVIEMRIISIEEN